jgi:hypothetical protein
LSNQIAGIFIINNNVRFVLIINYGCFSRLGFGCNRFVVATVLVFFFFFSKLLVSVTVSGLGSEYKPFFTATSLEVTIVAAGLHAKNSTERSNM